MIDACLPAHHSPHVSELGLGSLRSMACQFLTAQSLGQPMKYEGSWVELWNQRGISVCGFDMQAS